MVSRDRRRPSRSPGLPGGMMMRLFSALLALMILGMIYTRARDPRTWRWMADDEGAAQVAAVAVPSAAPAVPTPAEEIIPNPTDLDEFDSPEVQTQFAAIGERSELALEEMPLYWRFMKWTRAQSYNELLSRAAGDVLYRRFFEEPQKQRGKLVRLRLHIKQIVPYDAPENSAGVKTVYEISGTTDESRTYYYIVVCPELPPGMKTGTDLSEEGVFVGYFHKVMPYDAAIKRLAAPLLIGRLRGVPRVAGPPAPELPGWVWIAGPLVLIVAGVWGWRQFANPRPRRKVHTAGVGDEATDWFAANPDSRIENDDASRRSE